MAFGTGDRPPAKFRKGDPQLRADPRITQRSETGISPNGAFHKPYGASRVLADVTRLNYIVG